jgi:hypothetical protein
MPPVFILPCAGEKRNVDVSWMDLIPNNIDISFPLILYFNSLFCGLWDEKSVILTFKEMGNLDIPRIDIDLDHIECDPFFIQDQRGESSAIDAGGVDIVTSRDGIEGRDEVEKRSMSVDLRFPDGFDFKAMPDQRFPLIRIIRKGR